MSFGPQSEENEQCHMIARDQTTEDWGQVTADSTVVCECMVDNADMGEKDVGDEDEEA
jgi:hypothetical protein